MTTKIYRPSGAGGELQVKVGANWVPLYGVSDWSASGGARETSQFETLDGGVEVSVGQAGTKDITLNLVPSFFNAQYRRLLNDALYGEDVISIRYRTLANKSNIAIGGTGQGISIPALDAGYGKEVNLTFEKTTGVGKTALDAIKETSELGLLVTGTDTAIASGDRTEAEPGEGKFFIARWDGTNVKVSEWKGRSLSSAITTKDGWALIRYGIAFEFTCRVGDGNNPNIAAGSAISETITLNQTTSGFNMYPITKAAA